MKNIKIELLRSYTIHSIFMSRCSSQVAVNSQPIVIFIIYSSEFGNCITGRAYVALYFPLDTPTQFLNLLL